MYNLPMRVYSNLEKVISINELRRRFGEIESSLPFVDHFIITKNGVPLGILTPAPQIKKGLMRKTAGAFKNTALDSESFWKKALKKKSRSPSWKI